MTRPQSLSQTLVRGGAGRLFLVFWGSLMAVDVAGVARAPRAVAVGGVVAVVVVGSLGQHVPTALLAAGTGWLFVNGFVEDRLGVLRWHPATDAGLLVLLVVFATLAARRSVLDAILTHAARTRARPRVRS